MAGCAPAVEWYVPLEYTCTSVKRFAMCVDVILEVGIVRVSLEYQSVMKRIH